MFALIHDVPARRALLAQMGYTWVDVTSVPWLLTLPDVWALALSTVLFPASVAMWCLITALLAPCTLLGALYLACLPRPLARFEGPSFSLLLVAAFPLGAIVLFVSTAYWAFVFIVSALGSLPVVLVRVVILFQLETVRNNFRILGPHWRPARASFGWSYYSQTARATLGQIDRHGVLDTLIGTPFFGGFASAVAWVPIAKFLWCTNPFLYELEEMFVSQASPCIDPNKTLEDIKRLVMDKVSCARNEKAVNEEISKEWFCPHYPFPAKGLDSSKQILGAHYMKLHPRLFGFTRTTFVDDDRVRSQSCGLPLYRVVLDISSLHFLTGYVEANITKEGGIEHPCWCVVPKYGKLGRDCLEFINILFLPYLQQENKLFGKLSGVKPGVGGA